MENQRHSEIFRQGVAVWNQWRKEHPNEKPYLTGMNLWGGGQYQGVNLRRAHLMGAGLRWSDFSKADFSRAHLSLANLKGACCNEANFNEANLSRANLKRASFTRTNFSGANLRGSWVRIEQLSKARTLYKVKLDPELAEQVKKYYPHLLEEPEAG